MAAFLALLAAVLFALSAALQQRGQITLARHGRAVKGLAGLVRLLAIPVWLLGTLVSIGGYVTQGAALDRGRLVVVQPLLVTTIVWALPLGYWLTAQHVERRQVLGAGVVVIGPALFVLVGDPNAGVDNASTRGFVVAMLATTAVVAALLLWLQTGPAPAMRAAVLGVCAGLCFGLSATFSKLVINDLHLSIAHTAADWRTWALLGFGFMGFVIQQLSLATGHGIALYHERLTRPGWHVGVAILALFSAFAGAVVITLANRETEIPGAAPDLAMTSADVTTSAGTQSWVVQ